MTVTIYHNPACGTSRNTLALIRATGINPTSSIISTRRSTARRSSRSWRKSASDAARRAQEQGEKGNAELGLDDPTLTTIA